MQDYQIIFEDKNWGAWSIDKKLAHELIAHLENHQPKTVLETGSGITSVILAIYKKRHNATVYTLEHDEYWLKVNQNKIRQLGLSHQITLAPLIKKSDGYWYGDERYEVDFCFIDGPPQKYGRDAMTAQIDASLYWLDDANRQTEQDILDKWGKEYNMVNMSHKGLAVVNKPEVITTYDDITVTILTGRRPELLSRTIESILANAPGLLETGNFIVLHNSNDKPTAKLLDSYDFIDNRITTEKLLGIGEAMSLLMSKVHPNTYVIHFEDDFIVETTQSPHWFNRSKQLLKDYDQVKLRHVTEKTLGYNMVTHEKLFHIWHDNYIESNGHWTNNVSMFRSQLIPKLFPAHNEMDIQQKFHEQGMKNVQLYPGIAYHIGDDNSLRVHGGGKE